MSFAKHHPALTSFLGALTFLLILVLVATVLFGPQLFQHAPSVCHTTTSGTICK